MNNSDKMPVQPTRKRKTLAERMEVAKISEAKAAETLRKKKVRLQKYEAIGRKNERKLDTRKKIIAGALALEHLQFDGRYGAVFRALIDEYVTRDQDRGLFDLEPLPEGDRRRINPPKVY